MGLCLRLSCIGLFFTAATATPHAAISPSTPSPFKQADVCELLKESHEDLHHEYPNEYYDCNAHSRFFKMGSIAPRSPSVSPTKQG